MPSWLTPEFKARTRALFERKYQRSLSDEEVNEIAENVADLLEVIIKFRYRQAHEEN